MLCLLYFGLGFTRGGSGGGMAGRDFFEAFVKGCPELFKFLGVLYGLFIIEGLGILGAHVEL